LLRELKKKDWLSMLGLSENMIPKALILRGTRNLRNQYENYHTNFTDVINIKSPNNLLEDIFVGKLEGVSVAYASVYGSSMAADVVHVFGVLGTSLVLQTGCCGALADGIRMGDLFIATEAYRGEGASAYYNPEANIVKASFKADKLPLIQKVHDVTVHSGRIYTTSALFMEGKEQVEDWSNKGCTAVDMETAATFAVANYFRMGSAAILYVFDNPRYETDIVTSDNEKDKKRDLANKRMMELTFEIVKSYYSKKKCLRTAHRKKVRMGKITNIKFPADINWRSWIERWDKMQDYYIARRAERFDLMVRLIADTQETVSQVLDIGCGTGSLMLPILERFQESEVCGIDFDETLLLLAEKRLAEFNGRAHLIQADLRDQSWTKLVPAPIDAAVSATALRASATTRGRWQ